MYEDRMMLIRAATAAGVRVRNMAARVRAEAILKLAAEYGELMK